MEIFTNEFREELMDNLETITIGLKSDLPINKVKELNDKINLALQKEREIANPKKKKKNQFEVGDVVYYLGCLRGEVVIFDTEFKTIDVQLDNGYLQSFMFNGSLVPNTPIVLSHFPYKLKMKKIKK